MKEEQYRQHGLVNVAVADALIEQEAGVSHHRFQGVLPHDVVQLVRVQVLVHQLVAELAEVADAGAGGARREAPSRTEALCRTAGQGLITTVGQIQAATATVQADRRAAVIVCHLEGWVGAKLRCLGVEGQVQERSLRKVLRCMSEKQSEKHSVTRCLPQLRETDSLSRLV